MIFRFITPILLLIFSSSTFAAYTLNMPEGVTSISHRVHNLHMTILWICVAIGIVVYSVMLYAIVRHRKSIGHAAASFHESTTVEIIWSLIPFVILVAMAIPATYTLIHMDNVADSDLTIKITGHQWFWQYDYIDDDVNFYSYLATPDEQIKNIVPKGKYYLLEVDKPVVMPIGKKIRLLLTSSDVIHAWWVPDFAIKKDAIPGFVNEIWTKIDKPGTYRGQCAELCGARHGFMPIVVEAKTQADYDKWLLAQKKQTTSTTHNMTKS